MKITKNFFFGFGSHFPHVDQKKVRKLPVHCFHDGYMEITGQRLVQRTGRFASKRAVLKISLTNRIIFFIIVLICTFTCIGLDWRTVCLDPKKLKCRDSIPLEGR